MTDATIDSVSIIERENLAFEKKGSYNTTDLIVHAVRKSGRNPFAIGREMIRYSRSKAKLKFHEYVQYRFYDRDLYTDEERAAFISAAMHGRVVDECLDYGWFELCEDKWLSSVFLDADDTPQPLTLAVIDTSPRGYQGVTKIETPEALKDFLTGGQEFPLFCKFNNGRWSVGANIIDAADATHLHLRGKEPMSHEQFFTDFIGENVFLIQNFVENHEFLRRYTPTTATVRMVNMWTDKTNLWTPHAILKLPSARNAADNFWRDGNLVCNLDAKTGEILTVVSKDGPDLVNHDVHPETGAAIIGQRLPHWDKVLETNARMAALHYPVKYASQDIAITDDGPVVIEFNHGGAFELPQIASGTGFMTPQVREFFRSIGSTKV